MRMTRIKWDSNKKKKDDKGQKGAKKNAEKE